MTHDELVMKLWEKRNSGCDHLDIHFALTAVVELHKPYESTDAGLLCQFCVRGTSSAWHYPCPTIEVIQQKLTGVNPL